MDHEHRKPGGDRSPRSAEEYRRREGEMRFRLMAEKAIDMMSHHAPDGSYLYVSPACRQLLGYEPEEMVGTDPYSYIHPEDIKNVRTSHDTILTQPTIYTVEYRIRRKDGTYIWYETNSTVVRDNSSGESGEIICVSRDITRRKRYEQALKDSETRLKAAQVLGKIGHWELLLATGVMTWSDEVFHLFERRPELGAPSLEQHIACHNPEDAALLRRSLREATEHGRECQLDLRVNLPSGRTAYHAALIKVARDEAGRIVRLFGIIQDITDRKKNERALADANRALEEDQEALRRKNTALREVLDQIDSERRGIAEHIRANVDRMVLPLLADLERRLEPSDLNLVATIRQSLQELTSPFLQRLRGLSASLSPRELEICHMIKNGLSSKDIAAALHTSEGTVRNQRKSVRRKLGIDNEEINLRLYLQQLSEGETTTSGSELDSEVAVTQYNTF